MLKRLSLFAVITRFSGGSVRLGLLMLLIIKLTTKFVRCNIFCYNMHRAEHKVLTTTRQYRLQQDAQRKSGTATPSIQFSEDFRS
jgi:hypothetical protein